MSLIPNDLKYTADHEWIRIDGDEAVVGITDHAQDALTDIVYVEFPEINTNHLAGDEFATVDSVKSSSPIYSPLSGTVTAVNELLIDAPEIVNRDPYGEGWMIRIKIKDHSQINALMAADSYQNMIET